MDHWNTRCHPGRILFEIDGVPDDVAREALRLGNKLPVRTKVVTRIDAGVRACGGCRLMTKIADLRSQTTDQLSDELLKLKKEQFNLRFRRPPAKWKELTALVKSANIARISTLLREKRAAS